MASTLPCTASQVPSQPRRCRLMLRLRRAPDGRKPRWSIVGSLLVTLRSYNKDFCGAGGEPALSCPAQMCSSAGNYLEPHKRSLAAPTPQCSLAEMVTQASPSSDPLVSIGQPPVPLRELPPRDTSHRSLLHTPRRGKASLMGSPTGQGSEDTQDTGIRDFFFLLD